MNISSAGQTTSCFVSLLIHISWASSTPAQWHIHFVKATANIFVLIVLILNHHLRTNSYWYTTSTPQGVKNLRQSPCMQLLTHADDSQWIIMITTSDSLYAHLLGRLVSQRSW